MKFNPANATPTLRLTLQAADYAIYSYHRARKIAYLDGVQLLPFTTLTDLEIIAARFPAESHEKVLRMHAVTCGVHRHPELKKGFTELVSALMKANCDNDECHADVDAWHAPSECHGDVEKSFRKEVTALLTAAEMSAADVYAEFERRGVDGKWVFQNFPQIEWDY